MMKQKFRSIGALFHLKYVLSGAVVLALSGFATNALLTKEQVQAQEVPAEVQTSVVEALQAYLTFRVPTTVKALFTAAVLNVEGDSVFGNDISVKGGITTQDLLINGKLTLNNDITGNNIDIDVKEGTVTASNLIYSVAVGSGLSVSGTQDLTITNTDAGSGQSIFKKMKVGSDTSEADSNDDTLEFASGAGISLSLDKDNDKITISNSQTPGFISSGGYAVLGSGLTRAGVGTSAPSNTFEVDSGTDGLSGFTFTRMNSSSSAGVGGGKVLSVDSGGKVILVSDQTGESQSAENILPSATNGMTLYFNGTEWVASDNMFHDGGSVGISNNAPASRLHINTNLASKIGMIVQGYTSQAAHLQEWRDVNGNVLSYVDSSGVFNGSANTSGSLNPGFTTGSVVFQGASGLTEDNSALFWDNTNNRLGIGTTTPNNILGIEVGSTNVGGIRIDSSGSYRAQLVRNGTSGGGRMTLSTNGTTAQVDLRSDGDSVLNGGNVGIGITPSYKLHVLGNTYVDTGWLIAAGASGGVGLNSQNVTNLNLFISGTQARIQTAGGVNSFGFYSASTELMKLTSGGLLGIGTSTPLAPLHVSSGYGGNAAAIIDQTLGGDILTASASGTTRFVVSNAGNVGIGTTTLTNTLNVFNGANDNTALLSSNASLRSTSLNLSSIGGTALFQLDYSGNTVFRTAQAGMYFDNFSGAGGINFRTAGAATRLSIANNGDINANSGQLFVQQSTGRVGLGTTSPSSKFDMLGDLNVFGAATVSASYAGGKGLVVRSAASQTANMQEWQNSAGTPLVYVDSSGNIVAQRLKTNTVQDGTYSNALIAITHLNASHNDVAIGNGGTNTVYLNIKASGRLGVGTSTPLHKLHVEGNYEGKALANFNETGGQDILTASASGTTRLVLTNAGYLGIGASSPTSQFTMDASTSNDTKPMALLGGYFASTSGPALKLFNNNAGAANRPMLQVYSGGVNGVKAAEIGSDGTGYFASTMTSGDPTAGGHTIVNTGLIQVKYLTNVRAEMSNNGHVYAGTPYNGGGGIRLGNVNQTGYGHIIGGSSSAGDILINPMAGSVGIGTLFPTGKLHVDGGLNVFGSATVSASYAGAKGLIVKSAASQTANIQEWQDSAGSSLMAIDSYGRLVPGAAGGLNDVSTGAWRASSLLTGNHNQTLSLQLGRQLTLTSGTMSGVDLPIQILHTSGTQVANAMSISTVVSQTGGASGITRGLYINPTITAAADWRSLELSNNSGYGIYQSGAGANNYFAGKMGIGTTSPAAPLHVSAAYGGGAGAIINQTFGGDIFTASASGTTQMTLSNLGRLGLGTALPTYRLEVNTGASNGALITGAALINPGTGTGTGSSLGLGYGASANALALINGYYDGTGAALGFATGSSNTQRMTILNNGNVGMGTTSPLAALHFSAGYGGGAAVILNQTLGGDILTASASGTTRFVVKNDGKVGINKAIPTAALEVDAGTGNELLKLNTTLSSTLYTTRFYEDSNFHIARPNGGGVLYVEGFGAVGLPGMSFAATNADFQGSGYLNIYSGRGIKTYTGAGSGLTGFWDASTGNFGLGTLSFGTSAAKVLAIASSTAPSTSITDGIQLWAEDVAGSHELRVRDEAGNITTLSPHNFSMIPDGRSEDLAWAFSSQRGSLAINADMTKALRLVEKISGEKLIFIKDLEHSSWIEDESTPIAVASLSQSGEISGLAQWSYNLWTYLGNVVFEGTATFKNKVFFDRRVLFADKDMAGTAKMKAGDTLAHITFEEAFSEVPAVTVTPQGVFVFTAVENVTKEGFDLKMSSAQSGDVVITWIALPVKTLNETKSVSATSTPTPTPSPMATPSPVPTTVPATSSGVLTSPEPSASPVVSPSPIATPSPVLEPTPTPAT